jgi:hypothetical protein
VRGEGVAGRRSPSEGLAAMSAGADMDGMSSMKDIQRCPAD